MAFLRQIWNKIGKERGIDITTKGEYEEKVSGVRNNIDYGITVNNGVTMRVTAVFAAIYLVNMQNECC